MKAIPMKKIEQEILLCNDLKSETTERRRWEGRSPWFIAQMERSIWKEDKKGEEDLRLCVTRKLEGKKKTISVQVGKPLLSENIEVLNLTVRSYNCLKRCGIVTIQDLLQRIRGEEDLLKIRNLGRKSAGEILEKLEAFQKQLV